MKLHPAMKILMLLVLFCAGSCAEEAAEEQYERKTPLIEYSPPNIDTLKLNVIIPPSYFHVKVTCAEALWTNISGDERNVRFEKLKVYFGSSEEITFINRDLREELRIEYDIKKKTYKVSHDFNQWDGEYTAHKNYDAAQSADSVLKTWGQKPLAEWGLKEKPKYNTTMMTCWASKKPFSFVSATGRKR